VIRRIDHIWNPRKICGSSVDAISSTLKITPILLYSITFTYCLIAFPLTPKHVTLNDLESPFCVKFCFCAGMFGALSQTLKHGFFGTPTGRGHLRFGGVIGRKELTVSWRCGKLRNQIDYVSTVSWDVLNYFREGSQVAEQVHYDLQRRLS